MKKVLSLILAMVMGLSLCACGGSSSAEVGATQKYAKNGEFVVNEIRVYTNEELIMDGWLSVAQQVPSDEGAVFIDFTMENVGKNDFTVDASKVTIDYNDGVEYNSDMLYHKTGDNEYKLCEYGYKLEKVVSEAETFLVVVPIPEKVIEDTEAPLTVEVYYQTFKIR